jgi:hypothetical protein
MGQQMEPNTPKKRKSLEQVTFRETLTQAMPLAPTPELLTPYQLRSMVVILWAIGAIAVGVAVGLMITPRPSDQLTANPAAVSGTITLATPPSVSIQSAPVSSPELGGTVTPIATTQAQAGNPIQTVSSNYLQPSSTPMTYSPGYSLYNSLQGTIGTSPVE